MRILPGSNSTAEEVSGGLSNRYGWDLYGLCCGSEDCAHQRSDATTSSHPDISHQPVSAIDWGTAISVTGGTVKVYLHSGTSFTDSIGPFYTVEMTSYEVQQIEAAFDDVTSSINVDWEIVTNEAEADVAVVLVDNAGMVFLIGSSSVLGFAAPPGTQDEGLVVLNAQSSTWDRSGQGTALEPGGFGYITIIHELGHAFGLAHPHDEGGVSPVMTGVSDELDSGLHGLNQGIFTTMTYNDGWPDEKPSPWGFNAGYQGSMMPIDIAALQYKYGSSTLNDGNSNYTLPFETYTGFFADWDSGGHDVIANTTAQTSVIDLRPATLESEVGGGGYVSHIGSVFGGLVIPHGVVIEEAEGGSATDVIYTNQFDNVVDGKGGNDEIHHLAGSNTYVGAEGNDTLYFTGTRADYSFYLSAGQLYFTDTNDNKSSLVDSTVENLVFNDVSTTYNNIVPDEPSSSSLFDMDGDGGDDMLFRRTSDGFVYARKGDDKSYLGTWGTHSQGEELLALADFDGDDRVDMLWQRSNGATFIQDSETKGGGASLWMGNYSGQELLAFNDDYFNLDTFIL